MTNEMIPTTAIERPISSASNGTLGLVLLLTAGLLLGLYYSIRFGGHWAETDSANMLLAAQGLQQTGQLFGGERQFVYFNGYSYQTLVMILSQVTGLGIRSLQQIVLPMALPIVLLLGYLLFHEIAQLRTVALLATALLLTQPEFLFVVLRGSHEKFGRALMILALLALFWSLRFQKKPLRFGASVAIFYLAMYGYLASNFLLGSSFLAALVFAMLASIVIRNLINTRGMDNLRSVNGVVTFRLPHVIAAVTVIAFLLLFFLYPPAQADLRVLGSVFDRLQVMVLSTSTPEPTYGRILNAWVHPAVYFLVSAANWLAIMISFPVWLYLGYRWLLRRESPENASAWLLWLLYGAFGLQGVLAILVDASGTFDNLLHRVFPSFSLLSVMLIAYAFGRLSPTGWKLPRAKLAIALAIAALSILAGLKASNEPSLVGWWTFYMQSEVQATRWQTTHQSGRICWLGPTERLLEADKTLSGVRNNWDTWSPDPTSRCFFVSDLYRTQAARLGVIMPELGNSHIVYDNGTAQWFRKRPQSPYQP